MAVTILIRNWSSLQSYKDRRPPWVRLHRKYLDDFTFHRMSDRARALLPMLWLLASDDDDPTSGRISVESYEELEYRFRIRNYSVTEVIKEIEKAGYIDVEDGEPRVAAANLEEKNTTSENKSESGSYNDVGKKLQDRNEKVTPENRGREQRTETENREGGKPPLVGHQTPAAVPSKGQNPKFVFSPEFEAFWSAYPGDRKKEKTKAFGQWRECLKEVTAEQVMEALAMHSKGSDFRRGFSPVPFRWLKSRPWEADVTPYNETGGINEQPRKQQIANQAYESGARALERMQQGATKPADLLDQVHGSPEELSPQPERHGAHPAGVHGGAGRIHPAGD